MDRKGHSGDVAGLGRRQEQDGVGDLPRRRQAADRPDAALARLVNRDLGEPRIGRKPLGPAAGDQNDLD